MAAEKYRDLSRIIRIFLILLLLFISMMYGYLCKEKNLPGSTFLEKSYKWSRNQPAISYFLSKFNNREDQSALNGRWRHARNQIPSEALSAGQRETIEGLREIGYVSGYEKSRGLENVTKYIPESTYNGFNLYISGHGATAFLIDMNGRILHQWSYPFRRAFPNQPKIKNNWKFWRRAHLYNNGDLLAIYDGFGLIKIDKKSELIWALPCRSHHDLDVDENGFIYILTREAKMSGTGSRQAHRLNPASIDDSQTDMIRDTAFKPVILDYIVILDQDGNPIRKVSILEAFKRSSYAPCLARLPFSGDVFHTNTVEVLDGSHAERSRIFKKGNILISVFKMDVIAIIDMDKEKVVWALSGQWRAQHQPVLLKNGHILLFDNRGNQGMSKVIEINPFTQKILWAYEGNPENNFFSDTCGSNQRLPNGNTLITESDSGRAFEVTEEKKIVWEFYNPARAGRDQELIATLFEVIRFGPDFPIDWAMASK